MRNRLIQAYRQAPWRIQTQWMGLFLLALALIALVAGFYLYVSAQAAVAGLELQSLQQDREQKERDIAQARNQLAELTSTSAMLARAEILGFKKLNPEEITYLVVPEYAGRQAEPLVNPTGRDVLQADLIKPVYTQSLWEWLLENLDRSTNRGR